MQQIYSYCNVLLFRCIFVFFCLVDIEKFAFFKKSFEGDFLGNHPMKYKDKTIIR